MAKVHKNPTKRKPIKARTSPRSKRKGQHLVPTTALERKITEKQEDHLQISYWFFASKQVALGYHVHEICVLAQKEFNLPKVPHTSTVSAWIDKAMNLKIELMSVNLEKRRVLALDRLHLLLRKWLPIATQSSMIIQRTKKEDGETVSYFDEDAYDEQIKAGNLCAKLILQEAQLEGLLKDVDVKGGENSKGWQAFISDAILNRIQHPEQVLQGPKTIEGKEVVTLELTSGSDEIDQMK